MSLPLRFSQLGWECGCGELGWGGRRPSWGAGRVRAAWEGLGLGLCVGRLVLALVSGWNRQGLWGLRGSNHTPCIHSGESPSSLGPF